MLIAVLGTGRSGTSMIARMLNLSGLYLGEEPDLWDSRLNPEMNPTGYWEHQEIHAFMDRLFQFLGGTWENPPLLSPGWEYDHAIEPFYQEAAEIVTRLFGGQEHWGWKLPKATVTIAFWQRVVPGLKFVVCVRNPLDFASSMSRHTRNSRSHLFAMWQYYNYSVLAATTPENRFVTFYEDYFPCYQAGLAPLLRFSGLPCLSPNDKAHQSIQSFHKQDLKHYASTLEDVLLDCEVPYLTRQLYLELLSADPAARVLPLLNYRQMLLPLLERALVGEGTLDGTGAVSRAEHERVQCKLAALRRRRHWAAPLRQAPAALWERLLTNRPPKTSKLPKPISAP